MVTGSHSGSPEADVGRPDMFVFMRRMLRSVCWKLEAIIVIIIIIIYYIIIIRHHHLEPIIQ